MTEAEARAWKVSPERGTWSSRDEVFRLVGGPHEGYGVFSYDCGGIVVLGVRGSYTRRAGQYVLDWILA